jgi:hypothetical protein
VIRKVELLGKDEFLLYLKVTKVRGTQGEEMWGLIVQNTLSLSRSNNPPAITTNV